MHTLKKGLIRLLQKTLPLRFKQSVVHLGYHIDPAGFAEFAHLYCLAPCMEQSLALLARRGFSPRTIFDVGANRGSWAREARSIWPRASLVLFEPNETLQQSLNSVAQELSARVVPELIGATSGEVVNFNRMTDEHSTGSSVLSERSSVPRIVEKRSLKTLDDYQEALEEPALLKMDVQGYELEVLRGAEQCLQLVEAVLMEVALIETIEGAPLLREILNFMEDRGFVAHDIAEMHRRPLDNALSQIDLIFLKKNSPLLADTRFAAETKL